MALLGLLRPAALTPLAGSAPPLAACLQRVAHRAFSMRGFDDRERGEEQVYFRQEEQALLKNLLKKMKTIEDPKQAAAELETEKGQLKAMVGEKYNMSDEDLKKLLEWKYSHST